MKNKTVAVLGAGTWGLTLGLLLHRKGNRVRFWDPSPDYTRMLAARRENKKGLPGVRIPRVVTVTPDLGEAVRGAGVVLVVSPSHLVRQVAGEVRSAGCRPDMIVCATKGIENDSLKRMSQVIAAEFATRKKVPLVSLSGPSHAEEVSARIPTAVVCASRNETAARAAQRLFMNDYFRVYTSRDIIGVEMGGSLKNVIALAAGICDGLGLGDNTKSALMTRGLAEITRLGSRLGARRETFSGLAGMGDLITTCASRHSRNRYVGEEIGKGKSLRQVLDGMVAVAEGIKTTASAYQLHRKYRVEMPITREIYNVLYRNKNSRRAVEDLMKRTAKPEF